MRREGPSQGSSPRSLWLERMEGGGESGRVPIVNMEHMKCKCGAEGLGTWDGGGGCVTCETGDAGAGGVSACETVEGNILV